MGLHAGLRAEDRKMRWTEYRRKLLNLQITQDSKWETLAQRRTIARFCPLSKAYSGERAWKAIRDRLRRPYYLSRVDHVRKIRIMKQRTDIGKYSFISRAIKN